MWEQKGDTGGYNEKKELSCRSRHEKNRPLFLYVTAETSSDIYKPRSLYDTFLVT